VAKRAYCKGWSYPVPSVHESDCYDTEYRENGGGGAGRSAARKSRRRWFSVLRHLWQSMTAAQSAPERGIRLVAMPRTSW